MKSFNYIITDEIGIHARPAGLLVKAAKTCGSKVTVSCKGKNADATKLMMLMSMGVKRGDEVTVSAEGGDEDAAIAAMEIFFKDNL